MSQPLTTTPEVRGHLTALMSGSAKSKPSSCRAHGEFTATLMPNDKWSECPDCVQESIDEEQKRRQRERIGQAKTVRLEQLREGSMIPRRFQNRTLDSYEHGGNREKAHKLAICRAYVERFDERLAQGGGLIFTGGVGTGKSHLAYGIGNALLTNGYRVMGIDVYELIDLIKERAFSQKGGSEREAIKAFVTGLDLLILDEVGAQLGTEWERLMLFKIINERYKEQLPTLLVSNIDRSGLGEYLGERIVDRMQEGGGTTLVLDWESYRQEAANA